MHNAIFSVPVVTGHKEDAVEIPFDPGERWPLPEVTLGPRRKARGVWAVIGSHAFDGHVVTRSRRWWLLLPAALEMELGIAPGDQVTVAIGPPALGGGA